MSNSKEDSSEEPSSLQSNLALGLHALAQPLAILRAKLYAESIARMDGEQLRQLATDSAGYVERLCTLFNYLQELVLAEAAEPELKVCDASHVLDSVFDGLDLWFADSSLKLVRGVEESALVVADEKKLSQAISSLLMIVHRRCEPGDTIRVSTHINHCQTEILVESPEHGSRAVNAETRLALALIDTNIRKQNGTTVFGPELSDLRVRVPNAPITS